ncbi:uncharacterized protein LOC130743645 [Lotus japonicus]|uniref:uncharacterized protein LOC130743645 n=1 Tax=Lotus japonicus TaxID=34305 RepID=UPI00258302EF|nr:uncharacterized protein LOC130743645 [Lotus japonicus]
MQQEDDENITKRWKGSDGLSLPSLRSSSSTGTKGLGYSKIYRMQQEDDENSTKQWKGSDGLSSPSSRSSSSTGKEIKNADLVDKLPMELLDTIFKKLNLADLFEIAGVSKSWRFNQRTYWKSFMESQSPFVVQKTSFARKHLSFICLPERKLYSTKMDMSFSGLSYSGCSSGYLIFAGPRTLLLMNPFTRRQKKVSTSGINIYWDYQDYRSLFALVKGSAEFVIVIHSVISHSLHVYQSRNSQWATATYWKWGTQWKIVDTVVFGNVIYALTNEAKIGVLNLNSVGIKMIELRNTPAKNCDNLRLVSSDEGLLVVDFKPGEILDVYKVDFSNMEYVKLDTLRDGALFCSSRASCYALSNPTMWGYRSNHVYSICESDPKCAVYSWSNEQQLNYAPGGYDPKEKSKLYWVDWCFRHLRDEVDYSLVE